MATSAIESPYLICCRFCVELSFRNYCKALSSSSTYSSFSATHPISTPPLGNQDQLESLDEALWRTLIGNRTSSQNPVPKSLSTSVAVAERRFEVYHDNPELLEADPDVTQGELMQTFKMAEFLHPAVKCWAGRRVCVTRKGLIGVVPAAAQRGDGGSNGVKKGSRWA
jgi:hypothetical protein